MNKKYPTFFLTWFNKFPRVPSPGEIQMKHEANHLTNAHWCEIIAKLSKPNAPSKRVLERKYEVGEGAIQKVVETMRIEEEPPIDDEIQPIETFVESKSAADFKGFETLHNIVLNIDDQLLCSNGRMEVWQLYDELRWSFETFHRNVNKLTLNVKC